MTMSKRNIEFREKRVPPQRAVFAHSLPARVRAAEVEVGLWA